MSTVMDKIVSRQEQLLDLMSTLQKPMISAVARTASIIDAGAERLPKMPTLPFASELPTAHEVIEAQYGFAAKLIDANKRFAMELADAVDGAAEATTKDSAKDTGAKKAAPKASGTAK